MTDPVFASLVRQSSITLPVAGTISTYTPFLGFDGVIGVKSGFTTAAGGCDVLAVVRQVHGVPTLLLAAVTGLEGPAVLAQAGLHALALVTAMAPVVGATPVLHQGQVVAHVSEAGKTVNARGTATASLLTWPGAKATMVFHPAPAPDRPGASRCPGGHRRRHPRHATRHRAGAVAAGCRATHHAPAPLLNA